MTAKEIQPYIGRFVDVLVGPQSTPQYRGILVWAGDDSIAVEVGEETDRTHTTTLPYTPIPIANVWKIMALDPPDSASPSS